MDCTPVITCIQQLRELLCVNTMNLSSGVACCAVELCTTLQRHTRITNI